MVLATTNLIAGCAHPSPVVSDIAGLAKCQPDFGFNVRWTRAEKEQCESLNERIDAARKQAGQP